MMALMTVLVVFAVWLVAAGPTRFYVLCTAAILILPLIVIASRQTERVAFASHWGSILFCAAAGTGPLVTNCMFLVVFVIGESSNVAQMAGETGFDYWRFWFDMWPCLLIGNPLCAAFALMGFVLPPYHPRYVAAWALPLTTMFAALAATDLTFMCAPDA